MNRQTKKLLLSYLAVIMTLSIIFSAIIYGIVSHQLNRPLPPQRNRMQQIEQQRNEDISQTLQARINERDASARQSVLLSLLILNCFMLLGGVVVSYALARRTLAPIEDVMSQQEQFISDASHELRTPLTALLTTNEVALRKNVLTNKEAKRLLASNITEIKSLRELTDSLLDFAKTSRDTQIVEDVKLQKLTKDIVAQYELLANKKAVTVKNSVDDITLTTYKNPLYRILSIFIDNAIKYSPEHSTISIGSSQYNNLIKLYVRDQGDGIPDEQKNKIFQRFYRVDQSRTQHNAGYGLGLSIADSLAKQYGYTLAVEDNDSGGSIFSVSVRN